MCYALCEEPPTRTGLATDSVLCLPLVALHPGPQVEAGENNDFPDGAQRRLLDVYAHSALGWEPRIDLERGIRETYTWFIENAEGS